MKTTIDIADPLLSQAKRIARERSTTLREIVEEGLRRVIEEKPRKKPFRLRDASVGGEGMVKPMTWDEIRDIIYEGRGA